MKYSSCMQEVLLYMKQEILNELNLVEDHERECKLATGGLPESIWETYSSVHDNLAFSLSIFIIFEIRHKI